MTTTRKTAATPKRVANKSAVPGPKPEFVLIGDLLHYNAPKTGIEIIVDVDPPFGVLDDIMNDDGVADDERAQFRMMMQMLGNDDVLTQIRSLRTSEFFALVNRYIDEVQKNLGVSLGESVSSEDDSESTATP